MIEFYKVESHFFEVEKEFSFNIYFFDKRRDRRIVGLHAGSPMLEELSQEWKQLEEKGVYFQIHCDSKKEFLYETGVTEEELLEVNKFYIRMFNLQAERIEKFEEKSKLNFLLKNVLNEISQTDDFMPLISRVRDEVLCFPLTMSETVSITTELIDKLFVRDIAPVRVAALSYMIAKQNKIVDIEQLSMTLIAALLKDLGLSLIRSSYVQNFEKLSRQDIYEKHAMLSIYILSKTGFEFNKKIKRLILEHHEQSDGSGFPKEKKESHIEYLSFIINLSDQVLMYSSGRINGRRVDLMKTLKFFHKGVDTRGVNVNFPQRLLDSLASFFFNDLEKQTLGK